MKETLRITGRVDETFCMDVLNSKELFYCKGSIPAGLSIGYNNLIDIEIDLETGRIVGWEATTLDKIKRIVYGPDD